LEQLDIRHLTLGISEMLFPQSLIDDLRLQANIVQVVQEFVSLKRVGAVYKGLCPFHAEKTPSFQVNPEKGFFHCFGCGVGGDVFKFLELHEKVAFPDAVRMLAQKFGVALPEETEGDRGNGAGSDTRVRESLLKIHESAAAYFRQQLAGPGGARARKQLADRGVTAQTIEQLGLGFAPASREGLKTTLAKQGFGLPLMLLSGLVKEREHGVVDLFRNRLVIPICREQSGSVIAFGGRAIDGDQVPKYLNSPETPIYTKGRTLYGLNLTKSLIRKSGFAVLVEGYFDFAQVFQTQAAPVVATCGTALTTQQAQLLRRFTSRVLLSFDPDTAGESAATRSCELLVSESFEVNVVTLEKGEDPDTFIRRNGAERYRDRLRRSRPYLEFLLDRAADGLDFGQDDSRRQFLHRMLTVAARIPDPAARDQFGDRIAHQARITEEVVRTEIRKAAVNRRTTLTVRELPSFGQLKQAERALIWGLVHNVQESQQALSDLETEDLEQLAGREIFEMARSLHDQPANLLPPTLLQRLSTMSAQLVTSIAASATSPAPPVECVLALKRLRWERERAAIQREIDRLQRLGATQHGREIDDLWQQKKVLLHRIERLT
jgi:DNA primase